METPFVGEIRAFGFGFVPEGWAPCDGKVMAIAENPALASLLGNQFGGNGHTTFALPDLRGRTPAGADFYRHQSVGASGGAENATLSLEQMPIHTHELLASQETADQFVPTNQRMLAVSAMPVYSAATQLVPMADGTTKEVGGGASFAKVQPSVVINYCIALIGEYPPRP